MQHLLIFARKCMCMLIFICLSAAPTCVITCMRIYSILRIISQENAGVTMALLHLIIRLDCLYKCTSNIYIVVSNNLFCCFL
jgi:hypothetical protein